ncbi:P-loop nucleoside triphosphate hydrolases superfamily protein with CH domain-containing protein [Perilla frutescens var. hirtella]|nr:P-loop nucleoside triphosphate hydrolases superfamily protein with CH domain-containing protein [Perilla frutescens var. hirtella]KAH6805834.1 P-loop nucleoside triphosphate hydrolases superfamily protein with CH domain-containing protein [Perilla frutescens var. frutescens]
MGEGVLQFNVASMVEDVLQQHGKRLGEVDFASRRAQETSLRRYEATRWLRKMAGVVLGKDLPAEPSEEDFRIGLRSGIILCTVLNKVHPGSVPKVVEAPIDSVIIPDGAALTAFQYFENVRNFLVAIQELGIPTFEVSDLEQGGKSSRIVNCIDALKSYHEWKQSGGNGVWKFSGNSKLSGGKPNGRRNSDLFMNFLSRNSSASELSDDASCVDNLQDCNEGGTSPSLQRLVRELLSEKNSEDMPMIVESILNRVKEEFERKLERQNKLIRTTSQDKGIPNAYTTVEKEIGTASQDEISDSNSCMSSEIEITTTMKSEKDFRNEASGALSLKTQELIELQQRSLEELKSILHSTKQGMHVLQLKYHEDVDNLGKQVMRLAGQASGYHKVLEENRKLYNQVQDLKGNIRVYCRVRPFLPGQQANGLSIMDEIVDESLTIQTSLKNGKGKKTFTFNKAFGPNSTQEEVFADTQPLIRSVLDGYNVCIFAYGQTGSGKTFTMELTKESLGVNYRALSDLFEISEQRRDTIAYNISVQMMEIYNEQVRDLLVTDGGNKKYPLMIKLPLLLLLSVFFTIIYQSVFFFWFPSLLHTLEIRNNSSNGINVPNANLVPVTSTSDVIELMNLGHKNRAVGSTSMNDRSSRSHSCLTVHVQGRDVTSGTTLRGCMHLVDLAGSERCDKTDAVGDRLKEAQHINRSLSALGDVIAALAQKNAHVPYRNSKLTQLLQDSLGGQAKTLMFVHISPEPDALGETISTLKFAERVSTIELGAAKSNKESAGADVKELKEQIATLKAALARKEGGGKQSSLSSPVSSPSHSSSSKGEEQSNCSSRRQSLDSQDSLNSPPAAWPTIQEAVKGGSRKRVGRQSPEFNYGKGSPDASKIKPALSKSKSANRRNSLEHATDDSDFDAATSESSELDYQWNLNLQKPNNLPTVVESKLKRPIAKPTKIQETTSIRSLIPQAAGRVSNGVVHSPLNKNARPSASAATVVRRRPAVGK